MVAVMLAPGQGNFRAYLGTFGHEKAQKDTKRHERARMGTIGHKWARLGMVWATIYGGTMKGIRGDWGGTLRESGVKSQESKVKSRESQDRDDGTWI